VYFNADAELFRTGGSQVYETPFRDARGVDHTVMYHKAVYCDKTGTVNGQIGVILDITERKRMEERLAVREREFRTLAENSPDNIARFDCHCRQIYVNPTMERSLGLDPTWLLGKTPIEQATDDTSRELGAAYEQRVRRVLETGEPGGMEVLMPNPSGGLNTHLIRIVAERDTVGTVVGALAIGRDITERKQAEEALYKSELRLQLHVQHTPLGVIEWDADFRVVSWNPAAEKLFGYSAAEAIGRHAEFIVPLSVRPHVDRVMNDLLRCSGGERSTNINVTKDGRELIGEWYNTPLVTADGQVIGIASLMHDITERKRLEDALAAREREFRAIVENSPDTVSRYDRECRRTYINPTMAELLGRSAREDVGTKPTDQSPMPETVLFEQKIRDVFETGREFSLETPYKTSSGEAKWGHLRVVPEFASDGTIVSVLSIGRDINDLKEAEQALRENEQQFRTLSENSPNIIIRYNLECRRIYVNTAFTHEMGIPAETALNSTLDDVWLSEIKMPMEEYRSRLRQVMGTGAATELILEWRRPDTDHSSFHVFSVVPEKDQDGRISGCLAIGHNITEWRKAEHALNDKRKQLALIERELSVAEERERLRIASVLHDHIGQILLLGKMKLGALAAVPKPELVGSVIDEVRELLEQATNDAHSLTVQLNPPMLSVSGLEAALQWLGRKIESDYSIVVDFFDDQRPKLLSDEFCSILYQCARELLINAAKHAKTDKARLTVGREDDMYRLTVEDRGAGFNPDDIIPNISRDCRFGLFSIHVRIERLGGRMNIESSPGCGTLITILLPLSA
jgi:PAS domain S-box-containing protein